jgi:glycine cleavage system pyridoxal-binding protein P
MNFDGKDIAGFLFQYPDTNGTIENCEAVIEKAKKNGVS